MRKVVRVSKTVGQLALILEFQLYNKSQKIKSWFKEKNNSCSKKNKKNPNSFFVCFTVNTMFDEKMWQYQRLLSPYILRVTKQQLGLSLSNPTFRHFPPPFNVLWMSLKKAPLIISSQTVLNIHKAFAANRKWTWRPWIHSHAQDQEHKQRLKFQKGIELPL